MTMLQLAGPAAETAFRLSKLRRKLNSITDAVIDVGAHFAHYVFLEQPLTERELEALHALLAYGTPAAPLRAPNLSRNRAAVCRAAPRHDLTLGLQGH